MYKRVRGRNMPEKGTVKVCVLAVSVGASYFEGKKIEAIAHWMKKRLDDGTFEECYINVCDTACRHNFAYMGVNDNASPLIAKIKGNRWIKRNKKIFDKVGVPVKFMRWNQWLEGDETKYINAQLRQLYQINHDFKKAVSEDVKDYVERQISKGKVFATRKEAYKKATDCILEKIAVNTCMGRRFEHIKLYPGKQNQSSKLILSGEINAPIGLHRQHYVKLTER